MTNQKKTGIVLLIFGAAALAAWFGIQSAERAPDGSKQEREQNTGREDERQANDQADWVPYEDQAVPGVRFSLEIPEVAEVTQVQDTIYEIKYIGPESEPNTEITDGYYLSLRFVFDTSIETYLEEQDIVGAIATTTFREYDAREYERQSVLGGRPTEHLVIMLDKAGGFVDISQKVYGDTDGTYRETANTIVETLSFVIDSAALAQHPLIRVDSPARGEAVSSPITLAGEARGQWFFEATAPVVVVDWDGRILGEGYITADDEWMTEDFVPFSGELEFTQEAEPYSASGTVIFQRANPSDLPENDDAFEVSVILENN